jgi:hypothetical protein
MEEEKLNKEYKTSIRVLIVCNDLRRMKAYGESTENNWARYKQNGYTFKDFMEDTEFDLEMLEPYTDLDVAIANRLMALYLKGAKPKKWELYDLLMNDKLVSKFKKFKIYE